MLRVRRWAGLCVLTLAVASGGAAAPLAADASAATMPATMNHACALKTSGLMRYVSSTAQCTARETRVNVVPGPVHVCIHTDKTVHLVAALSNCKPPTGVRALTLPSATSRTYFCAANGTGVLSPIAHASLCPSTTFPVVVPIITHQPPVLANIESGTLPYDAGTPAVPVTSSLTVRSIDDANLAGATVTIGSGFASGEDTLSFTSANGITGSYNSSAGVLTLSGAASLADYQAALRSVTYSDPDGASPTTGTRTISFQANTGKAKNNLSNVVSRDVMVNANPPPTAADVSASTDKNTAIDINVLSSASDPDGDTLSTASLSTAGTKGSVSINPDGTIHYDPNGQFASLGQGQSATDSFTYQVSDGFHLSNSATVTVTVTGVSTPPVISNVETTPLSYQAQAPPVAITSTLTLSDADDATMSGATVSITSGFEATGDTLSFTTQNGITGSYGSSTGVLTLSGSASLADYQAALRSVEFSTSDSSASPAARTVSFAVTDSLGAASTSTAQRTIDVSEAAAQPPVAVNQSYTAVGNTPLGVGTSPSAPAATVSGSLLDGDSDPDPSATLSVTQNTAPAYGTVTVNPDGTFTYVPNAGFTGTDTFQYTIAGSNDPSQTATATVTVAVGPLVWYVDDSQAAAGTGQSSSPFNTLAAANSAAGANSIIFLYQGNATYTGGVTMKSGEDLWGQPNGLAVDGYSLVAAGGSNPVITNTMVGGIGIDLAENADVEGVTVSSPGGDGVEASNVNDATVGGATAVAISGAGHIGIRVSGGNGNFDFANTSVTGSAANSVSIAGRTGGTINIGGNVTDNGSGIVLSSNSGATISFSGKLTISTGAQTGFSATGGGTVTATGTGSTITTTTGGALNVANTTIGSSGLNFQSVSSNGASPGISLSGTGSSGGLTVTGNGTAGSGGTIQNSAGEGITLSSTTSPSLTDMVIKNNAADGIIGSQVNGLTLAGSTVSGNGTQANVTDAHNDDGLNFTTNGSGSPNGLTGTASITNSTITGSAGDNAIISDTSGSLNLTVTGSTFSSNNATSGNYGLAVSANEKTSATVSVTGSTFTNNASFDFQFSTDFMDTTSASGTNSVTFSNNTVNGGGGAQIESTGTADTAITADGNNIQNSNFAGISVGAGYGANDTGTVSGTINGNTVGTASVANSGGGIGIDVGAQSKTTLTLAITNNNLYQYFNDAGINYESEEGSPAMNLTITGNTIAHPGRFGTWGILGEAGALTTDAGTVCAAISGNSMTGAAQANQGGADFEMDQFGDTTFELPGYTGGAENTNAVVGFVQGNNTSGGTPSGIATANGSGGGFTGGSSCPAPS